MLRKTKEKLYPKVLDNYRGSRDWRVSMKELQNLMSIGDVAKSFGVCVATVRRWQVRRTILIKNLNNLCENF